MIKIYIRFILGLAFCTALLLQSHSSYAQAGMWTWVKGSSGVSYPAAVFGTQGVPAPANTPAGFYEGANWTDNTGNFWIMGGQSSFGGVYADLWKYEPATNNWTWMKGSGTASDPGVYGVKGVPALTNRPGYRQLCAATWTDNTGNLWLFGGTRGTGLNDLWRYNIPTNTWTWMSGSSTTGAPGVYGTKGVPAATNVPGGRYETAATWVDTNNNLWLFGGCTGSTTMFNDMWMYNTTTNEWTWMAGSNLTNQPANYGTKGVSSATNTPDARMIYCGWIDPAGKFWIFGGGSYSRNQNDMWKFDPSTNQWTWMSGTSITDNQGSYGGFCTPSVNFTPVARFENRMKWADGCNGLLMYGGGRGSGLSTRYNDLWHFNIQTLEWTLLFGGNATNIPPNYGTLGVAATTNNPGGRCGGFGWKANNGDLYMLGGYITGGYNDMWKFTLDSTCTAVAVKPYINLGPDTTICAGSNKVLSTGVATTTWSTGATGSQITVSTAGKYWATTTNACGVASDTIFIQTQSAPTVFSVGKDTLFCNAFTCTLTGGTAKTRWSNGVTAAQITVSAPGTYIAVDSNSCGIKTDTIIILQMSPPLSINLGNDTIYCNIINHTLSTGDPTTVWSTGVTAPQITVTTAGKVWATITNQCGVVSDTILLSLQTPPAPFSLGNDTTYCDNINRTLFTGSGFTTWSTGASGPSLTVTAPGKYWADVSNTCNSTSDTIVLSLVLSPPDINLGPDTTFCTVVNRILKSAYPTTLWSTGITGTQIYANAPGKYWATATNMCATKTDTVEIFMHIPPPFSLGPDISICDGDSVQLSVPINAAGYQWSNGSSSQSITAGAAGTYRVMAWDFAECPYTDSVAVHVTFIPTFELGPDTTFCTYSPYTLKVPANVQLNNFHWEDNSTDVVRTVVQPGVYTLTASNQCGTFSDSRQIDIKYDPCFIAFPNAFSPDRNGVNDLFMPARGCKNDNYFLSIYTRWGEKVFETTTVEKGWDGYYHGQEVATGVYVYYAEYFSICDNTVKTVKGNLTLIR